jgi:CRISPR/Cas system-associated endonuclease/helicase Cas3
MDEQQLVQQLELLKRELASSNLAEQQQEKMLGLIDRMEEQMHLPEAVSDTMVDQVEALLAEFEVEHPKLTGMVNNVLVTLGNMGV